MYIGDFNRVKGYRSLAAAVAEERHMIQKSNVREAFSVHREHSMETVAVLNDITYINNSVSTTINSTWYAFEETKGPTIWMAGGASVPNDYSIILKHVKKRVRAIICIGIDNTRIQEYFYGRVDFIISAPIMEDAVNYARLIANSGDLVLFSPGSPSFDCYHDYCHRGDQFRRQVIRPL